jgi:hypothetical protein
VQAPLGESQGKIKRRKNLINFVPLLTEDAPETSDDKMFTKAVA